MDTRSLGSHGQVVGTALDLDLIAVDRGRVIAALQLRLTTDGTEVLLVERQFRGATADANPRGDALGAEDGDIAGSSTDADVNGARGFR